EAHLVEAVEVEPGPVELEDPALLEQVRDAAALPEVAAVLREGMADLADGAVAVVGERLHQHRDAAGPVALVDDLVVALALAAAPQPRGGHQPADHLREGLAARGVEGALLALDRRPFGMAGHARSRSLASSVARARGDGQTSALRTRSAARARGAASGIARG